MSFKVINKKTGKIDICKSRNWAACRDHNVQAGWNIYFPPPKDLEINEIPKYDDYIANKGEHSETIFALWLVKNGHTLRYRNVDMKYKNKELHIMDAHTGKLLNTLALHIDDIIYGGMDEVVAAEGTFSSEYLTPVYNALIHNGVNPKAPSQYKSDITIVKNYGPFKRYQSLSIKSFLGSNPSILNANKAYSALEYKLNNPTAADRAAARNREVGITPEQVSRLSFVKYCDPKFQSLVEGFTSLPKAVLQWKQTGTSNLNELTPNTSQKAEGRRFVRRIVQGTGAAKPSKVGVIDKDGKISVHSVDKVWESTYFDAPSRSRHDYGYFYESNGEVYIRIAIGIRSDHKPFKL